MANQINEALFQAVDTIIASRIENLPYDQTIICTIEDIADRDQGKYKVFYNGATLIAFSENQSYQVGERVYLTVPRADYSEKKMIIGRVVQEKEEAKLLRPFENYTVCTDSLTNTTNTYTLRVNDELLEREIATITLQTDEANRYIGYDTLGLKFALSTKLENNLIQTVSGDYSLKIDIWGVNLETAQNAQVSVNSLLDSFFVYPEDIVGNLYNTAGYCNQEKVFDISNWMVTTIKIVLRQGNNFLDQNGERVPCSDYFSINIKDVFLTFGYKGNYSLFSKGKFYLYCPQGYLYSSSYTNKTINGRYIRTAKTTEGYTVIQNTTDLTSIGGGIHFWEFNPNSSIYVDELKKTGYELLSSDLVKNSSLVLTLKNTTSIKKQYYTATIKTERAEWIPSSNELTFINAGYIENSELIDSIMGFQISALDEAAGVYNIYGPDNLLLNDAEAYKKQAISLTYNSTSGRTLKPGDIISWKIPIENTMLRPLEEEIPQVDGKYMITLTESDIRKDGSYLLQFLIKDLYNPNYTNNTIDCYLSIIDELGVQQEYTANKEILFGTSGSSGNDYIFILELTNKDGSKTQSVLNTYSNSQIANNYVITPRIYDYNMRLIEDGIDLNTIKYSWLLNAERQYTDIRTLLQNAPDPKDRIIKAEYQDSTKHIIAYLPIATSNDSNYHIEGCKTITYDITGKKPIYYKQKYQLYNKDSVLPESFGTWSFINPVNEQGYPTIKDGVIIPASIYRQGLTSVAVKCSSGAINYWIQPILITQNKYPSAMWNDEMNKFQIEDYCFDSTLVGKFELKANVGDTKLSGVAMAQVSTQSGDTIGLYCYKDGKNLFALDTINGVTATNIILTDPTLLGQTSINEATIAKAGITNLTVTNKITGSIQSADRLGTLSLGSTTKPVYFKDGVPIVCDNYPEITPSSWSVKQANDYNTSTGSIKTKFDALDAAIASLQAQINALK